MTINRIFTAILAAGSMLTASAAADTLRLSLNECISIALSESPTVKVADMEITRMDYSRKETLGQLLPSISFGASYNRTLAKQTMYMNMDGFGDLGGDAENPESKASASRAGSGGGIKVGLDNSYSMGFNLSMPLIAPQLWKSLDLSDSRILQSVEQARQSRISLVNQIKNAYYTLLLAEDSYNTILESYDMARFTADLYAKQHSLGAASDYDVLRTEVAVKNVEPELTQATIAIKQAKLQLLILMGVDASQPIAANSTLAEYEETMYADVLGICRVKWQVQN